MDDLLEKIINSLHNLSENERVDEDYVMEIANFSITPEEAQNVLMNFNYIIDVLPNFEGETRKSVLINKMKELGLGTPLKRKIAIKMVQFKKNHPTYLIFKTPQQIQYQQQILEQIQHQQILEQIHQQHMNQIVPPKDKEEMNDKTQLQREKEEKMKKRKREEEIKKKEEDMKKKKQKQEELKRIKIQFLDEGERALKKQHEQLKRRKRREGPLDDMAKRWNISNIDRFSDMVWTEFQEQTGLPQVYRFWDLGDDENSGIWTGQVLWSNQSEELYGDDNMRFGILWADGYYSEEELDMDIFWFTEKRYKIDFHIEGEERVPKWILDRARASLNYTPPEVIHLYDVINNNPPPNRVLTPNVLREFKSALLEDMIIVQKNKLIRNMMNKWNDDEAVDLMVVNEVVPLKLERVSGDGKCMYRGVASNLNYFCGGDGNGEGQINWNSTMHSAYPPTEEDALSELIKLASILAIEDNLNTQPYFQTTNLDTTYREIIANERPRNYINNILVRKNLSSDYWGSDMELHAFVNFVMPELRVALFDIRDNPTTPIILDSPGNIGNPHVPTVYVHFTGNHFNALYNEDRDQQKTTFDMTRSELVARLIEYVYRGLIRTNRRALFKKKLQFILDSFDKEEAKEMMAIWLSRYEGQDLENITGLLEEMGDSQKGGSRKRRRSFKRDRAMDGKGRYNLRTRKSFKEYVIKEL